MRQAIVTKYLGPTNSRGSRVKATAEAGSVTVPWDDRLYINANHTRAARLLAHKMGWTGRWVGGGLPPAMGGNVYVPIDDSYPDQHAEFVVYAKEGGAK